MDKVYTILGGVAAVIALAVIIIRMKKAERERIRYYIKSLFGVLPERHYTAEEFDNISHLFRHGEGRRFCADDITWNDLDMDTVFRRINATNSSVGEEYLYRLLREPELNSAAVNEFDTLTKWFDSHADERLGIQEILYELGRLKFVSLSDYLESFMKLEKKNTALLWLNTVRIIAAAALMFYDVAIGMMVMIGVFIYNVSRYYKELSQIRAYFMCCGYISRIITAAQKLGDRGDDTIADYEQRLKEKSGPLKPIVRKTRAIGSNAVGGGLFETLIQYRNMLFHTDIMSFYGVLDMVRENIASIGDITENIGRLDAAISCASYRRTLSYWCVPEFTDEKCIDAKELYHPLIEEPVTNDVGFDGCVLLTGSNASGKSTFLKTVAINAILSQSIATSVSRSCRTGMFRIYSSMALHDDLSSGESYYMVEIRSMKRIMDSAKEDGAPVLCFVDEVLRGTNTVERIAASTKILEKLALTGAFVFAATHDIELTYLLPDYDNYHFTEDVTDDDISFSYKLNRGRAQSRNAIRLLGIMGYDESVIKSAEEMAARFTQTGEWKS